VWWWRVLRRGGLAPADASPITFAFTGFLSSGQSNALVNAGDTFTGTYTLETGTAHIAHPDVTFDYQSLAVTNFSITMNSSVIAPFTFGGTAGNMAVGNNTAAFGDRYSMTTSGGVVPIGTLNFFQIDLQERHVVRDRLGRRPHHRHAFREAEQGVDRAPVAGPDAGKNVLAAAGRVSRRGQQERPLRAEALDDRGRREAGVARDIGQGHTGRAQPRDRAKRGHQDVLVTRLSGSRAHRD
jgi:hypothetical protein